MWRRSAMASQLGMLVLHTATAAADEARHSSTPAASSTAAAHGAAITPALFFVSPTGSDEAAGTSAAHPFATIEHALSGARGAKAGATITLLDGLYPLRAPVRITGADAGPGRPLTLQAHQGAGARPVLCPQPHRANYCVLRQHERFLQAVYGHVATPLPTFLFPFYGGRSSLPWMI